MTHDILVMKSKNTHLRALQNITFSIYITSVSYYSDEGRPTNDWSGTIVSLVNQNYSSHIKSADLPIVSANSILYGLERPDLARFPFTLLLMNFNH